MEPYRGERSIGREEAKTLPLAVHLVVSVTSTLDENRGALSPMIQLHRVAGYSSRNRLQSLTFYELANEQKYSTELKPKEKETNSHNQTQTASHAFISSNSSEIDQ